MALRDILAAKRDGRRLEDDQIEAFVAAVADGSAADAHIAAFCMAALINGLDSGETGVLTRAMTASGRRLAWGGLDGPVLDKHSTGGVGDKVSLVLAPVLAACGAYVPMIAGRGLGHTGGTIDKLESLPGYGVDCAIERFQDVVRETGCAIVAQSAELAPADRRLYAVRDVTATVESIPLIAASILSKKLAAGLDGLVMDVKRGRGAFMPTEAGARELARRLIDGAAAGGLPVQALITDMDQVLGRTAGNALEVGEALALLTGGDADPRLRQVVLALAGTSLAQGGLAENRAAGEARAARALASGAAAERFAAMVAALGGPPAEPNRLAGHLAAAPVVRDVWPDKPGYIAAQDLRALGQAVVALGGGRQRPSDAVDPAVGLSRVAAQGEAVGAQDGPLARVHARTDDACARASEAVRAAVSVAETPPPVPRVVTAYL